jgi:hypothetical protein
MNRTGRKDEKFVVCINNDGYPASLELHKIYRVLPDSDATENGDLRVVDESGEDYLYAASRFVAVELPRIVRQTFARPAQRSRTASRAR